VLTKLLNLTTNPNGALIESISQGSRRKTMNKTTLLQDLRSAWLTSHDPWIP
jgi:hypothetical protein